LDIQTPVKTTSAAIVANPARHAQLNAARLAVTGERLSNSLLANNPFAAPRDAKGSQSAAFTPRYSAAMLDER